MSENVEAEPALPLTWKKFWMWTGLIYGASLFGFLIKVSAQAGGFPFDNIWQLLAVCFLPAAHMVGPAVIVLIYLAFKKFDISNSSGFMRAIALLYMIHVAFRLISVRPI